MITVFLLHAFPVIAQDVDTDGNSAVEITNKLDSIQLLLNTNNNARANLREALETADLAQKPELEQELEGLVAEQKQLRSAFEQVAIGNTDVDLMVETQKTFDWKEEVTLVLQPIMENLKALTDKPRKINDLTSRIEQNTLRRSTIEDALKAIEKIDAGETDVETQKSLQQLQKTWQRLGENNEHELDLANAQLVSLQNSNVTWWQVVKKSGKDFLKGRGLTLLIAVVVAVLVWLLMRALLWLFQRRAMHADAQAFRTRRRLAQYAYNALMSMLILISVIAVFYVRGDLLLLGLSILATVSIALGLRTAIPRFISEAQLLLNLGSIREQERVHYNGLPWRVESINLQTILKNPELSGALRLPLRDIASLVSRPNGKEPWFPSRKGDFIVTDENRLLEVVRQTSEVVELRDTGGTLRSVPVSDYLGWSFKNLTRSETFAVFNSFGVDYQLQSVSADTVPAAFRDAIVAALQQENFEQYVERVVVELASAGSSSLDYYILLTMHRDAARHYAKLGRLIQRTCVRVCTEQNWSIPFPHLTVQQLPQVALDN